MAVNWLSSNPLRRNQGTISSLSDLGERMLSWHRGMSDPVYAVGSYYVSGQEYPDPDVVDSALDSLESELEQQQAMLRGEKIMVRRYGKQVDLRKFAGYSDRDLEENIEDLSDIVDALREAQRGEL